MNFPNLYSLEFISNPIFLDNIWKKDKQLGTKKLKFKVLQMSDSISIECKPCKKHVLDNSTCDENVSCDGKTSDVQDK